MRTCQFLLLYLFPSFLWGCPKLSTCGLAMNLEREISLRLNELPLLPLDFKVTVTFNHI